MPTPVKAVNPNDQTAVDELQNSLSTGMLKNDPSGMKMTATQLEGVKSQLAQLTGNGAQAVADQKAKISTSLQNSPTINRYAAVLPQDIAAQTKMNNEFGLDAKTGLNGIDPLNPAKSGSSFELMRDHQKEADMAKKLGGLPSSPEELDQFFKATYSPDQLSKMGYTSPPVNASAPSGAPSSNPADNQNGLGNLFSSPGTSTGGVHESSGVFDPVALKAQGYTDDQIKSLSTAGNLANDVTKPTNSSIRVLENALNAKSNVTNQPLGQSDLFKQAGLDNMATLQQSIAQRGQEMNDKYNSFKSTISDAAAPQLERYKMIMDNYNTQVARFDTINKDARDYEHVLARDAQQHKWDQENLAAAHKWELEKNASDPLRALEIKLKQAELDKAKSELNQGDASINSYFGFEANPIDGSKVGSISGKYESGNDPARISSGKGDAGGVSYGSHQLSSKTGTLNTFLKQSQYGKQFAGLEPGTKEFNAKWTELAKGDPSFGQAQDTFIASTHYLPQVAKLEKAGLGALENKGQAVQEMIYSTSVQYGPKTDVIQQALKGKDVSKMSDADIIKTVQTYKNSTVGSYFGSSSPAVQNGVKNRTKNEMNDLLLLAENLGGSGAFGTIGNLIGGAASAIDSFLGGGKSQVQAGESDRIAKEEEARKKQALIEDGVKRGILDEQGNALTPARQSIRMGEATDAEIKTLRESMTKAVNQGKLPSSYLDQFSADVLYGKVSMKENTRRQKLEDKYLEPPTEVQGKSLGFALSAKQAESSISDLSKNVKNLGEINDWIARSNDSKAIISDKVNEIKSPEAKQIAQAELQWIANVLRGESGAAIAKSEYVDAGNTYFPRPGDQKADLDRKAAARQQKIENLLYMAGPQGANAWKARGYELPDYIGKLYGIESQGGATESQLQSGEIMVKDKNGNIGAIPENEFDSSLYTKI